MPSTDDARFSILVHGGAGFRAPDSDDEAARAGCQEAARAGHHILARGGSALDAVQAAVQVLENNEEFNAGKGSALTSLATVEMDASIMEGLHGRSGAVGAVKTVQNPVVLARAVMEKTVHLLLVGPGAELFAQQQGLPVIDNTTMVTARARHRLALHSPSHGTVGAVAVDRDGTVAAATSTGGTMGKLPGRMGDTGLIGCGTFADNATGAASATGHGETIIRVSLTRFALSEIAAGRSAREAVNAAVEKLRALGNTGGLILCTPRGELAWAFNTSYMPHAWVDAEGREGVSLDGQM